MSTKAHSRNKDVLTNRRTYIETFLLWMTIDRPMLNRIYNIISSKQRWRQLWIAVVLHCLNYSVRQSSYLGLVEICFNFS